MLCYKKYNGIFIFLLLVTLLLQPIPVKAEGLNNNNQDTTCYILKSYVKIENNSKTSASRVKLEVPIIANINSPYQKIIAEKFSIAPVAINESDNGNRMAVFDIGNIKPGSKITIVAEYKIKVYGSNWLNSSNDLHLNHPKIYLSPGPKIESNSPEIKAIAQNILNQVDNHDEVAIAQAAFDYTIKTLKYSLYAPSVNQGALSALENGAGSCVEFASLFVAITRAAGVPARIVNGFADKVAPLSKADSNINLDSRHQWVEFFVDGKGWIPADPTLSTSRARIFGKLPVGYYVAQNYGDSSIKGKYNGGKLSISYGGYWIREAASF